MPWRVYGKAGSGGVGLLCATAAGGCDLRCVNGRAPARWRRRAVAVQLRRNAVHTANTEHPAMTSPTHRDDAAADRAAASGSASNAGDDGRDALAYLARRYSVGPKHLREPGPGIDDLRAAVAMALRAPDHGRLRPFRFVRVLDAQRERLASLFAADAARRGHAADEVERARERAWNGPVLVALVARVGPVADDVPEREQWISVGGGLTNFLNALHLMGYGAKALSGASVRDPDIQAAFCRSGETLVAWIAAGTPARQSQPKADDDVDAALADWEPPPA